MNNNGYIKSIFSLKNGQTGICYEGVFGVNAFSNVQIIASDSVVINLRNTHYNIHAWCR